MRWILLYSAAIGSAELAYVWGHPTWGLLLHALALIGLLNHYALRSQEATCDSLLALALLPLARMASVVMPIHLLPPSIGIYSVAHRCWLLSGGLSERCTCPGL